MYICTDCGHVFDEPMSLIEIHDELDWGKTEIVGDCCPACLGGFEEAMECDECGKVFSIYDLVRNKHRGICEDCLRKAITLENFYEFSTSGFGTNGYPQRSDLFEEYTFWKFFQVDAPEYTSPALRMMLKDEWDKACSLDPEGILDDVADFLMDEQDIREGFYDWLNK